MTDLPTESVDPQNCDSIINVKNDQTPIKDDDTTKVKESSDPSDTTHIDEESKDDGEPPPITKKTLIGLFAVYFSVFLDMMGVSLVQPILPFYAEKFGANSLQLGALYSSYSLMAIFASYFMGKASDKFGRRPSILFSLFGTMIGFTITGLATDYWTLLSYRFLTGVFGGSAPIAQAYVTDVVPSNQRPKYLAFTGASAALAYIFGPGIGAGLSEFGIRIPFFVSGGLGGFGLIFAYCVLNESHPRNINDKVSQSPNSDEKIPINVKRESSIQHDLMIHHHHAKYSNSISNSIPKTVWFLGLICVFNMLGWTSVTSMLAYYLIEKFGLSTLAVGYTILSLATIFVFTNVIIFSNLNNKIGTYYTAFIGLLIFSIGIILFPLPNNLWLSLFLMGFGAGIGNGLMYPATSSMAADYSNPSNRGKILAFNEGMKNIGMVIGPLLHGIVFDYDMDVVYFESGGFVFIGFLLMGYLIIKNPNMRRVKKLKQEDFNGINGINDINEKNWEFIPDKPTDNDIKKLGVFLSKLLSDRNYTWVSHYDKLTRFLNDIFPKLRTSSVKEYAEDVQFLREQATQYRNDYYAFQNNLDVSYA